MNKRQRVKESQTMLANLTPERRRAIAYHEAGHASMWWMFGNLSNLIAIDMRPAWQSIARVLWSSAVPLAAFAKHGRLPAGLVPQAKQQMMVLIAGYAVESRLSTPRNQAWLDEKLDEGDIFDGETFFAEDEDLYKSFEIAKLVCGGNGRAMFMLRRVAAWTDEAFLHPRLWAVVEALAELITAGKTRISGRRAAEIMTTVGGDDGLPYMKMGRQWRRRFSIGQTAPHPIRKTRPAGGVSPAGGPTSR